MGPRCDSGREDGAAGWRVLLIQRGRTMIDARRLSSHVSLTDDNASVVLIGASAGELYAGARQTGPARPSSTTAALCCSPARPLRSSSSSSGASVQSASVRFAGQNYRPTRRADAEDSIRYAISVQYICHLATSLDFMIVAWILCFN